MKRLVSDSSSTSDVVARRSPRETFTAGAAKLGVSVATLIASVAAPLLAGKAAHATWVNDGTFYVSGGTNVNGGNCGASYSNGSMSVSAFAGTPNTPAQGSVGSSASVTIGYEQRYHWDGAGTYASSFKVSGSGNVKGSAIPTGSASASASSSVSGPGFNPSGSAPPDYNLAPSGNINVAASTADPNKAVVATTLKASAGGYAYKPSGGYSSNASASYTIGNPF